jgi:hypothetical protein
MSIFKLSKEAKEYWCAFWVKILENLASVKVWFFIFPFIVSTVVMAILVGWHIHFMKDALATITAEPKLLAEILGQMKTITDMFIGWCTFNVSLAGVIIVARETFKVNKLKALNEEDKDNSEVIEKIKP